MLNFLSSMLCTSKIHPFLLGNYLGTSLIIGNLMRIRVTSVEWNFDFVMEHERLGSLLGTPMII
jgi:fido (protein-threonine AMPylation protein)